MSAGPGSLRAALAGEYAARCRQHSDIAAHLPYLHATALGCDRPVVIELGVRAGNSTSALLAAVTEAEGELWSADIAEPQVPAWWRDSPRWRLAVGSDLDPAVLGWMPAACDVLFIDTSHDYAHTLAELRAYVPRVRPGGTVLMHDTELEQPPPGEVGHVPQPPFPVAKALDAYCAETGLEWVNRPRCYGLGVIRVPS